MKLFSLALFHPGPNRSKDTFLITEFLLTISSFLLLTRVVLWPQLGGWSTWHLPSSSPGEPVGEWRTDPPPSMET